MSSLLCFIIKGIELLRIIFLKKIQPRNPKQNKPFLFSFSHAYLHDLQYVMLKRKKQKKTNQNCLKFRSSLQFLPNKSKKMCGLRPSSLPLSILPSDTYTPFHRQGGVVFFFFPDMFRFPWSCMVSGQEKEVAVLDLYFHGWCLNSWSEISSLKAYIYEKNHCSSQKQLHFHPNLLTKAKKKVPVCRSKDFASSFFL